jgi:hypothetical protein
MNGEADRHGLERKRLLDSGGRAACCPLNLIGIFLGFPLTLPFCCPPLRSIFSCYPVTIKLVSKE